MIKEQRNYSKKLIKKFNLLLSEDMNNRESIEALVAFYMKQKYNPIYFDKLLYLIDKYFRIYDENHRSRDLMVIKGKIDCLG